MKNSLLLMCGLVLPMIAACGSSSAADNVEPGTAAIAASDAIQDCSSGGDTCSTNYPQVYCSEDGETHFRDVTVPLTFGPVNSAPRFGSPINPEKTSQWIVFPKGWRVDEFRRGVFHPYAGPKRFVSVREGTIIIRVTDGEERTFKKGDIFEAVDLPPCKGRLDKSEDGVVLLLTNHS